MAAPEFIDNRDGNTLAAAIGDLLANGVPKQNGAVGERGPAPGQLDIATAFFSPAGFAAISERLGDLEKLRLIIGAEPPSEARPPERPPGLRREHFERELLDKGLETLEEGLREERNRFPFTRGGRASLRKLIEVLQSGRMETRRYERAFMHAKAYVFAPGAQSYETGYGVIAGSSNLTRAGVSHNLELNLGRFNDDVADQARDWFARLWDEAVPFDLLELLEEVFAEWTPFQIFLRTLYQLYGGEVEELAVEDRGLPLTNFQKHGAARAMRLIKDTGGAIVADEVGLGKTFIAGEIMKAYVDRRQRALLICPAQLRDTTWRKFRHAQQLMNVECLSYEELYLDQQLAVADPDQFQEKLLSPLRDYQLIIVDEAHNYRNPDTPTRAAVLRKLLWGQKRDVLLLTATPVNNTLWDLYHLIRYYMRQDAFLANRGILSIRERFEEAAREDPSALSPDMLYPVIDATTVKRTRQFVKKHYSNDIIKLPDGTEVVIVFPEPRAITVRYSLPEPMPALFDRLEAALDPNGHEGALTFARYAPECYLRPSETDGEAEEAQARAAATMGLLRSGLLKRFESSAHAFRKTVTKLIAEHDLFLEALSRGHVVTTRVLHELAGTDDEALDELLGASDETMPAGDFKIAALQRDVEGDLATLRDLRDALEEVTPEIDPKLKAILQALRDIAREADQEAIDEDDARQKRKVIIFSFFADTVSYLRHELARAISADPELAAYRNRIVAVAGSSDVEPEEVGRQHAVSGFAPISTESPGAEDRFDILIATDVLAEGVNLQQGRHIINYDVPWNPMRLVQRHGRIDRIGSQHTRVFLRTIFPADRLDQLLNLEQRIMQKIALAAASIGVVGPVEGSAAGERVFTETREEIERLLAEDATLFERGGTAGAGQTGEEYRQTLRKELERNRERLVRMPYGIGSGMMRGDRRGVFFCASIGERIYLRFVPATGEWIRDGDASIIRELGTCLRLIECTPETARHLPQAVEDAVFDLWEDARQNIYEAWMTETDPANLQPKVRPLNHRVAEFIRANRSADLDARESNESLDILEAPWPRREEALLRDEFNRDYASNAEKVRSLVEFIRGTGLEPFAQPPLLPPIEMDDIRLVCWMAIEPTA
jgi:hypothetical protein